MRRWQEKQKLHKRSSLQSKLSKTNLELGQLNRALASKMIALATQTGEMGPLEEAVAALRSAQSCYSVDSCPYERVEVQQALADTLLIIGRFRKDKKRLESAKQAYRSAITLASMLGDEVLREDLRSNYKLTLSLLGASSVPGKTLFNVA